MLQRFPPTCAPSPGPLRAEATARLSAAPGVLPARSHPSPDRSTVWPSRAEAGVGEVVSPPIWSLRLASLFPRWVRHPGRVQTQPPDLCFLFSPFTNCTGSKRASLLKFQFRGVLPKFLGIFGFQVLGQPTPSPASDLVVGPILSMQKSIQPLLWVIGCPENGFVGLSFGGRAVHHKPTSIVVHTARTPHSTLLAPCTPRARHSSWPRRQPPAPPPPLRCRPAASRHGLRPRAWPHRHPGPCPTHHGVSLWRSRMHVPSFPIGEVIVGSTRWGAFYPQPSIIRDSCPQYGGCCGVVQPVCKSSARAASNMAPAGGTPRPRPLTPAAPAPAPAPQRCHPAGGETHRIRPPAANPGNGPQRSSNCSWKPFFPLVDFFFRTRDGVRFPPSHPHPHN